MTDSNPPFEVGDRVWVDFVDTDYPTFKAMQGKFGHVVKIEQTSIGDWRVELRHGDREYIYYTLRDRLVKA
jgi:hypothetical protein